jgi:hypothetical protein
MRATIPLRWLIICLLVVNAGCGPSNIDVGGNEEQVQQAVSIALDAWKSDQEFSLYSSSDSKLVVADEDWQAGLKLKDYRLLEPSKVNGGHWRQRVELDLVVKNKVKPKVVYYAVTLGEPTSILRSDFSH